MFYGSFGSESDTTINSNNLGREQKSLIRVPTKIAFKKSSLSTFSGLFITSINWKYLYMTNYQMKLPTDESGGCRGYTSEWMDKRTRENDYKMKIYKFSSRSKIIFFATIKNNFYCILWYNNNLNKLFYFFLTHCMNVMLLCMNICMYINRLCLPTLKRSKHIHLDHPSIGLASLFPSQSTIIQSNRGNSVYTTRTSTPAMTTCAPQSSTVLGIEAIYIPSANALADVRTQGKTGKKKVFEFYVTLIFILL